jgi:hypothetical protein
VKLAWAAYVVLAAGAVGLLWLAWWVRDILREDWVRGR